MDDRQKFAETMVGIAEVYGKDMSEAGLSVWWSALSRYSTEQVTSALNAHVQDAERGQFMPKPGDIVRQIEGTPDDAAMTAWHKVDNAVRRVGYGPTLVFDDPKIHQVISEMGGFAQFGRATEHDMQFLRSTFTKRYAGLKVPTDYPPSIAGWHTDGKKVFIGDESRCKQVLESGADRPVGITDASETAVAMIEQMEAQ